MAKQTKNNVPLVIKDYRVNNQMVSDNTRNQYNQNTNQFTPEELRLIELENNRRSAAKKQELVDRQQRIKKSIEAQGKPLSVQNIADQTQATGDKFRLFPEEHSFFDDYINPGVMIGNMASGLGRAPLNIQQGNYGQAAMDIVAPIALGRMMGSGSINPLSKNFYTKEIATRDFANQLLNPLAGVKFSLPRDMRNKVTANSFNPLEIIDKASAIPDKIIPRPLNPQALYGSVKSGWNDIMPLNILPEGLYGEKLSATSTYPNFVGFRKFGNSIDDVVESQSLRPNGPNSQISSEGNWAESGFVNENYPGVFEATMNPQIEGSNIMLERVSRRNGILGRTKDGSVEIPITDPGLSFNRRLPFSNRYVPINKEKLINNEFQLSTQLPHLQSLAEKYGLYAGLAAGTGYVMGGKDKALENIKTMNNYITLKPLVEIAKEEFSEKAYGGEIRKYNRGGLFPDGGKVKVKTPSLYKEAKTSIYDIEDELQNKYIPFPYLDMANRTAEFDNMNTGLRNGYLDALRHSTTSALLARNLPNLPFINRYSPIDKIYRIGASNALGAAHEMTNYSNNQELMSDLENNYIGSKIGANAETNLEIPMKTYNSLKSGKLNVVNRPSMTRKISPDTYMTGDFENGGEIRKYLPGGLHKDLQGFKTDLTKLYPNVRFTSEVREGAKTKQGKPSRHATGEAVDLAYTPEVYNFLWNTTEGTSLLSKYELGLLDESTPEMLKKTGGTGAHLHVGKDNTIPSGRNRHIELMQAQLKKINEDKLKEQENASTIPPSTEQVKTDEQTEAQIQQNDESQNEYLTAAQIMEANRLEQSNNMNNILSRYNSTNEEWMKLFQ